MEDLKNLSSEINAERKLLEGVVDSISSFVETYQNIKTVLTDLNIKSDFNVNEALDKIKNDVNETNNEIIKYAQKIESAKTVSEGLNAQVSALEINVKQTNGIIESLNNKLQVFLETQSKALESISKLDEYMSNIKNIDFKSLDEKITKYAEDIKKLDNSINKDIKYKIEQNSKEIENIQTSLNDLTDKLDKNDISQLLNEIKLTNTLITEAQKEKFALNQDLDSELNFWADRNGIKRKKR